MRTRFLLLTALAAWVAGAAHAWPALPPRCDTAHPAPALDQLIDQLAGVRAKEAELQARRADLERQVRERLDEQARRLEQVGVAPAALELPGFVPGAVPTVLSLQGMDIERPVGGVAPPTVFGRRTYSPGSVEIETVACREREPGWTQPGELADRIDALGGLPAAYTRWRNTGVRWGPEPPASCGFSPIPAPRPTFTPGGVEAEPCTHWDREPRVALPGSLSGELSDRFDALGGFPVAYTRWWRDTALRARRGPAPEPLFRGGGFFF